MRPTMAVMSKSAGVKTVATPWLQQGLRVGRRDDPADHHGDVARVGLAELPQHVGTSSACPPERIDSPTQCTSSATAAAAICPGVSRMPE